jgi:SARP family transcriptional regulator, regulator of embCAB operon
MDILDILPDSGGFVLAVLGGFVLLRRRGVLTVPRGSQRLLALLALRGGVTSRATVAGMLWPDASERHAYINLRSALSRLGHNARTALMASRLELGLAEDVAIDVRHARALAHRLLDPGITPDQSDLGMGAVAALSVDLLPDWYDDWVLIEAEDWRQLRVHALEALAARLTACGRWGEAASAARAAVRAEPLRESARAALIQVHLTEGNPSEAVRQFARYRALLHAELRLEPSPRLYELIEDLQRR